MSRQRWLVVFAVVGFVTTVSGAVLWGTAWGLFGYVPLVVFAALAPDRPRARHAAGGLPPPKRRQFADMGSMTWEEEWKWRHHFEVPPTGDEVGWEAGVGADDQGGGWDGGVDWPPPTGEPYGGLPPPLLEEGRQLEVAHEDQADDADWARRLRDEIDNMPELGTELPGAGEGAGEVDLKETPVGGGSPAPVPGTWPAHAQGYCQPGCFWCRVDNERLVNTFDMPAITEQAISDWGARLAEQIEGWHTEPWATQ